MKKVLKVCTTLVAFLVGPSAMHAQGGTSWLTGCWTLRDGAKLVEENWTAPQAGVLLGIARTIANGKMTEYEFVVLRSNGRVVEYGVRLGDQPEVMFTSTKVSANEAVFENPANPFPKRIGYRLASRDSLEAWIDGGAGSKAPRITYLYRRSACANP